MKKRIILLTIFAIYISSIILSPVISAEDSDQLGEVIGIFDLTLTLDSEDEIEEPLKIGEPQEIEINVKYKLNIGPIMKLFFGRRITRAILFGPFHTLKIWGKPSITVNLTLESPEWCDVSLEKSNVNFEISRDLAETKKAKLAFTLKDTAPALVNESIDVTANFIGLWTIKAATTTFSVSTIPEYISDIEASAEKEFTIPPLKNYSVPINITNNGNGETSVSFEVEKPDGWNVSFSSEEITIPVNETKQVNFEVIKPPKKFKNETLTITLKPKCTNEDYQGDEANLKGTAVTLDVTFINDGSLEDDEEEANGVIDITLLIVILLVVIIVIIVIFYIRKRVL